jgi:Co/Zn/Cd efflux system component
MTSRQNGSTQSYQNEIRHNKEVRAAEEQPREIEITNEYVLNVAFWTFLGFLLLEAVFALIANSQAMLEDAEAMSVDALTYLFNLWAERIKHRPYNEKEMQMPAAVREYKRELLRLYLEVIPPFISVTTLVIVTVYAMKGALVTLRLPDDVPEEDVDVNIMMWFSGANLLLDIVNVACFARAHQAFGLTTVRREVAPTRYSVRGGDRIVQAESQQLILNDTDGEEESDPGGFGEQLLVNLNMCSGKYPIKVQVTYARIKQISTSEFIIMRSLSPCNSMDGTYNL